VSTYVALLDGGKREVPVDVVQRAPGVYEVRIGGEVHVVDAYRHDHGTLSLLVDTQSYTATLDERGAQAQAHAHVRVRVQDSVFAMEILDEKRLRLRRAAGKRAPEGRQILTAPIAGRVVKVRVKVGDAVRAGQALVAVEAMKMENEVRSPKDGKVVELNVAEGQVVEGNARLCAVE
jgi:biotin carboxyl carrier protein